MGDSPGIELVEERTVGVWRIERARGTAAALHASDLSVEHRRSERVLRVCEVLDDAVVLGSSQPASDLDAAAVRRAGLVVARRRSGGGAVVLRRGSQIWIDLFVPASDPLWDPDVERASWWVGEWWAAALGRGAGVHREPLVDRSAGSVACFASVGPGEVTDRDGRKVVGISQRRTRLGSRFQSVAHLEWDPDLLLGLVADRDVAARLDPLVRGGVGVVGPGQSGAGAADPEPADPEPADRLLDRLLRDLPP